MKTELFKRRKYEFVETIMKIKRLPNNWEYTFSDGEDMRKWYDDISKLGVYDDYIKEIKIVINKYHISSLSDEDKKQEFLNCINKLKHLPSKKEALFSDKTDMFTWYLKYKNNDPSFESIVKESLPEYEEIDLTTIWPELKDQFINLIKQLKRVPRYGEIILENNYDMRLIYDKLEQYDPVIFERILLHLQTYKLKQLTIDERVNELKNKVFELGYIPYLQEARFSDGTDMFTWYMRYQNILPKLNEDLSTYINNPNKNITIYSLPKFKNQTGKYYCLETNEGEILDLTSIISTENMRYLSNDMKGRTK